MKLVITSAVLLCAFAGTAAAETFTFKSTSTNTKSINIATGASSGIGATFNEGESQVMSDSGKKSTTQNECAAWSTPPGSQFTTTGVCKFSEGGSNEATITFTCLADAKAGSADCWGGLRGVSGTRVGKNGTISWHQTQNPDGVSGVAAGTGMWND